VGREPTASSKPEVQLRTNTSNTTYELYRRSNVNPQTTPRLPIPSTRSRLCIFAFRGSIHSSRIRLCLANLP